MERVVEENDAGAATVHFGWVAAGGAATVVAHGSRCARVATFSAVHRIRQKVDTLPAASLAAVRAGAAARYAGNAGRASVAAFSAVQRIRRRVDATVSTRRAIARFRAVCGRPRDRVDFELAARAGERRSDRQRGAHAVTHRGYHDASSSDETPTSGRADSATPRPAKRTTGRGATRSASAFSTSPMWR